MKNKWKHGLKKLISLVLVTVIVLGVVPLETILSRAAPTGGFEISLNWNDNDGSDIYEYDSVESEQRVVRLNVKYSNKNMTESFAPGTVAITVPGIKEAGRSEELAASSVAADKASSAKKEYAWSYTYNASADTYTFTNNNTLSPNSPFAGSFEILWTVDSRSTKDGYRKELQAVLRSKGGIEVQSNKVEYEQMRKEDEFELSLEVYSRSYNGEGLDSQIKAQDYWWVNYQAVSIQRRLSLGLADSYFEILIPADAELRYAESGWDETNLTSAGYAVSGQENINGRMYNVFRINQSIHSEKEDETSCVLNFIVIYPKSKYDAAEEIETYARIYGEYYDLGRGIERLDTADTKVAPNDYPFPEYKGEILYGKKTGTGTGIDTDFARSHSTEAFVNGYIDSRHIANGEREYAYRLTGGVVYPKLSKGEYDVYDLEMIDEQVEIYTEDGAFRLMEEDEYEITSLSIPANKNITNQNKQPVSPCDVVVSIKIKGSSSYTEYRKTTIMNNEQKISLPEHVCGVKVEFLELEESIQVTLPMTMKFHTDAEDIVLNGGQLVNTVGIVAYAYSSGSTDALRLPASADQMEEPVKPEEETKASDIENPEEEEQPEVNEVTEEDGQDELDTAKVISSIVQPVTDRGNDYWTILDNGKIYTQPARLYILERPNFYYSSTALSELGDYEYKQGGLPATMTMYTVFAYMEEEELSNFSMYTILPDNMKLGEHIGNVDDLYEKVSFGNTVRLNESELEKALTIVIDNNYKGSGRTMVKFSFSFDSPVVAPVGSISVSFPVIAGDYSIFRYGLSTNVRSVSMIEDEGLITRPNHGLGYDNGRYAAMGEEALWSDLNNDGITDTTLSTSTASRTKNAVAIAIESGVTKLVATESSSTYTIPAWRYEGSEVVYEEDEIPLAEYGSLYSYKLRINPLLDRDQSYMSNIILMDALETGDNAKWKGKLESVDASEAEYILSIENERDVKAEIFYSNVDYSSQMAQSNYKPVLSSPDWSTVKMDDVKTIAVSFGDAKMLGDLQLSVTVTMRAPSEETAAGKITENRAAVFYEEHAAVGGSMGEQWLISNPVPIKLTSKLVKLTIVKTDEEDGTRLAGAEFDLYYKSENGSDEKIREGLVTNSKGEIVIRNLAEGDYYLIETKAPKGYEYDESRTPISFQIKTADSVVEYTCSVTNKKKKGSVVLEKRNDLSDLLRVSGAEFELYNAEDNFIGTYVTDGDGKISIDGLAWGDYYFIETKAPEGYEQADRNVRYEFSINAANDAGAELEFIQVVNQQIPAAVRMTKYEKLEDGTETDIPLANAFYVLYTKNGQEIGTYMTDHEGAIYIDELAFGTYYFIETIAVNGYYTYGDLDSDGDGKIWFTLEPGHTAEEPCIVKTFDQRKYGSILLQKTDDEGNVVDGAQYTLYKYDEEQSDYILYKPESSYENPVNTGEQKIEDEQGQMVNIGSGIIRFYDLTWGDYLIKETKAPPGYELSETEYKVTIGPDTVNGTYRLEVEDERSKGTVKLIKFKENGNPENPEHYLEGAEFNLYRSDGTLVSSGHTTDENGEVLVTGIEWGSYYFEETKAPDGYGMTNEKIRFSVNKLNAGIIQEFVVENPENSKELKLTKRIDTESIVFSHGSPTFIFKIEDSDNKAIYKSLVFDEGYVNRYLKDNPDADYIESSIVITGLGNDEYKVTEVEVIRYELNEIILWSSNAVVNHNEGEVTFDLKGDINEGYVTFYNEKTYHESTSENAQVNNLVKSGKKLTAITAVYTGGEVAGDTFDRSTLQVQAYYDDGTDAALSSGDYDLPDLGAGDKLPDSWGAGDYTLTISYTEGNVTKTTTISISIEKTAAFIWRINSDGETATITKYTGYSPIVDFPDYVNGNWESGIFERDGKTYKVTGIEGPGGESIFTAAQRDLVTFISLPKYLETIDDYVFMDCVYMEGTLHLPDTLKKIGKAAFKNCSSLSGSLIIPESVTEAGEEIFYGCTGFNGDLEIYGEIEIISDMFPKTFTGSLVVGDKVKEVERKVFYTSLFTGDLYVGAATTNSDGIMEIKEDDYSSKFTGSLTIGGQVRKLDWFAFFEGKFTGDLYIDGVEVIEGQAFDGAKFAGKIVIGDSVKELGEYNFLGCEYVEEVIIGDGLETIAEGAFSYMHRLKKLTIGANVKVIEEKAFMYTASNTGAMIEPVYIPDGVTTIGSDAFAYWRAAQSDLYVPESVTNIASSAFTSFGTNSTGKVMFPVSWTGRTGIPYGAPAEHYDYY